MDEEEEPADPYEEDEGKSRNLEEDEEIGGSTGRRATSSVAASTFEGWSFNTARKSVN